MNGCLRRPGWLRRRIARGVIDLGVCLAGASPLLGGSIELAWTPVPGATGYRVYHGEAARTYDTSRDVGASVQASLANLVDCAERFVAVKSYGPGGESLSYSEEISGWPRPEIHGLSLSVVQQGAQVNLEIDGVNFQPGAEAIIRGVPEDIQGNPLVRLDSVQTLSCHRVQALLSVAPSGSGFRAMRIADFGFDLEVRNPDSVFGSDTMSIVVALDEERLDIDASDEATRGRVDGEDLAALARAFASEEGWPLFDPDADLDGDGRIDGADLAILARSFGDCWTGSGWSGCVDP